MSLKWERIKSEPIELNASIDKLVAELPLDLGDCFSDREIPIRFLLKNELGIPVSFEQVVASCGCLAGVPANISLKHDEVLPIRLLLKVPKEVGDFGKSISVLDKESGCQLKFLLKGKSKSYISLSQNIFPIVRTGKITVESRVKLNLPGFTANELIFKVNGGRHLVSSEFIPESETIGRLVMELDVPESSDDFAIALDVFANEWDKLYTTEIQFPAAYKPSSRPKTLVFHPSDNGQMSGRLLLQLIGIPEEGVYDLQGRVIDDGRVTNLTCKVKYRRVNDVLRFAEISTEKIVIPEGSKAEVEFVSGDLRLVVPFTVF
jgi:hypothetical protein